MPLPMNAYEENEAYVNEIERINETYVSNALKLDNLKIIPQDEKPLLSLERKLVSNQFVIQFIK